MSVVIYQLAIKHATNKKPFLYHRKGKRYDRQSDNRAYEQGYYSVTNKRWQQLKCSCLRCTNNLDGCLYK